MHVIAQRESAEKPSNHPSAMGDEHEAAARGWRGAFELLKALFAKRAEIFTIRNVCLRRK